MSSLQTSCRNDATELEAFIANATVMLENKALPKNAKELSEISGKQQALQQKMPEVSRLYKLPAIIRYIMSHSTEPVDCGTYAGQPDWVI